jgi:hypothetical protein
MNPRRRFCASAATVILCTAAVHAHDGPPFPILSDHVAGPYVISIWTDPDTTDDGSPGGQFWIRIHTANKTTPPPATRAMVTVKPLDRPGPEPRAPTSPIRGDVTNQFAALVMDHEGRFAVQVLVDGPLGSAAVDSTVEATYNLRPPRTLILLFVVPFLLVGLLWGRLLIRRRGRVARSAER